MSVFTIVIPAYNEEDAVVAILERSKAAAQKIKAAGMGVTEVEIILVNDGSRDRTEERARNVSGVTVLGYHKNKGYGAAIKTGFAAGKGDLLGFLDSDGTCDPLFFIDLIRLLQEKKLDVTLGSRLNPNSKMPAVRVLGNRIFRTLVNVLGETEVEDVASGMRVLRRDALPRLAPLPDGLNFTPAMSARAALDKRLKLGELPMPYEERVGRSKLSVVQDGLRFLGIILDTAITFRPRLFFGAASAVFLLVGALALALPFGAPAAPLSFYLTNGRVEDWMIFRVILISFCACAAAFLFGLGKIAQALVAVINEQPAPTSGTGRQFLIGGAASFAVAVILNRRLLASYFSTGRIPSDYWVFPLVGMMFALVAVAFVGYGLADRIARLLAERERARRQP